MKSTKIVASTDLLRTINRSTILDLVRDNGPISRAQISRDAGVSLSTTMRIIDELTEEGLVAPAGVGKSTGGRPGSLVDFNHNGFAVIGIDLGGTKIYGSIHNLGGEIYSEARLPSFNNENHSSDVVEQLCRLIDHLMATPRPQGQKIMGIGIGTPGFENQDGDISVAPSLKWNNFPLRKVLTEHYQIPVFIENDVNLAALGEFGFGAGRGCQNMVCVALGTGIGAGIIIGGALYKGHGFAAGEVGYIIPGPDFLKKEYSGFGALEQVASGTGIAQRARQMAEELNLPLSKEDISAKYVFSAARDGEHWACKIVDETIDYLTICLANISALINPQLIVLTGGLMGSADLLLDPIQRRLEGLMPAVPRLAVSSLGPRATVMGATLFVLTAATGSHAVRQLP